MSFELRDKKDRIVLHMNRKGKLALSRYPDLSKREIDRLAQIYQELAGADVETTKKFLRFEEDDEKFCS